MATTPQRYDPLRGFKFIVEIQAPTGEIRLGCNRVSGLREETEQVEYREGNEISTVRKIPGLTSYDNITLERGQISGELAVDNLLAWRKMIKSALSDGDPDDALRVDFRILVFGKHKDPANDSPDGYYEVREAWPATYEHADLDASSSDVWFERVEFANEGTEYFDL
jgi:phage tail-like protein